MAHLFLWVLLSVCACVCLQGWVGCGVEEAELGRLGRTPLRTARPLVSKGLVYPT